MSSYILNIFFFFYFCFYSIFVANVLFLFFIFVLLLVSFIYIIFLSRVSGFLVLLLFNFHKCLILTLVPSFFFGGEAFTPKTRPNKRSDSERFTIFIVKHRFLNLLLIFKMMLRTHSELVGILNSFQEPSKAASAKKK